tara:strand:- start:15690 stop:16235 length:546 start_codon:yes stop_codon:yes gene_type:complete
MFTSLMNKLLFPLTLLLLFSGGFAYSQVDDDLLWQREETRDPSGIVVSVEVGMRTGVPLTLRYQLSNVNEDPITVFLALEGDGVATNITISQAGKIYRSIHQYSVDELPELKPVSLLPNETIEWEYQIVDLVDNPEEFARIKSFERFGINLRFPFMLADDTNDQAAIRNRRGLSLRWSWSN